MSSSEWIAFYLGRWCGLFIHLQDVQRILVVFCFCIRSFKLHCLGPISQQEPNPSCTIRRYRVVVVSSVEDVIAVLEVDYCRAYS
jgi:hypothetical protein